MAASSGSHGKDIDRSSPWSDWTWDNRGFWMSTRFDSAGPLESSSGEQQIWQKNGGRIPSVPGNKSYEELDPRYHVIEDVKKLRKFWRVGRVFMMLWSEPARAYRDVGKSRDGSHYSTTYLNGNVYSEIRRFVVIREGHGNCICSPIHTYNNQATLKPNLPDVQQHAIIYTSKSAPPSLCSYNDSGEVIAREDLNKDPLRVIPEGPLPEADLGIYSRINYSKIYTVENYVRVLNIGLVHQNSMQSLIANSLVRQNDQAPQALRSKAIGAASTDNRDETQASENGERVDRSEKNKEKRKKPSGSGRKK
ncbi:hypothetical protein JHW43_001602 [Diplocarpon mali]|nr:hypothetical protein JHW43_001602 [Diplocarpon mali]